VLVCIRKRRLFFDGNLNKLCGRPPQYAHAPCKLTFDLLTLKVETPVSEMAYTVSSGTLNSSVPYHTIPYLESGVRGDVGYLSANFSLPSSLCSRLRPDVWDRQTSDVHHRLIPPPWGRGHNNCCRYCSTR